jgi:hypothetical protein
MKVYKNHLDEAGQPVEYAICCLEITIHRSHEDSSQKTDDGYRFFVGGMQDRKISAGGIGGVISRADNP